MHDISGYRAQVLCSEYQRNHKSYMLLVHELSCRTAQLPSELQYSVQVHDVKCNYAQSIYVKYEE